MRCTSRFVGCGNLQEHTFGMSVAERRAHVAGAAARAGLPRRLPKKRGRPYGRPRNVPGALLDFVELNDPDVPAWVIEELFSSRITPRDNEIFPDSVVQARVLTWGDVKSAFMKGYRAATEVQTNGLFVAHLPGIDLDALHHHMRNLLNEANVVIVSHVADPNDHSFRTVRKSVKQAAALRTPHRFEDL